MVIFYRRRYACRASQEVNPRDLLHLALFVAIIATGFFDAVMDGIAIQRIHRGYSPLRDTWHIAKHAMRLCVITVGALLPACWRYDWPATLLAAGCGTVLGKLVWDSTYARAAYWFAVDERLHVRTGWKWLDRICGLHW